jgi:ubiquinone/menaquinone biosynthesis C-methylase UbiE
MDDSVGANQRAFLESEADAFHERNRAAWLDLAAREEKDELLAALSAMPAPRRVLEVGCGNGWRLELIRRRFGAECWGVEPSRSAVKEGAEAFPKINLVTGTAETVKLDAAPFDLVILGFFVYLCDRADLFRLSAKVDSLVEDPGLLAVIDFHPPHPYRNAYDHNEAVTTFKFTVADMFTWSPSYTEIYRHIFSHARGEWPIPPDQRVGVSILQKASSLAYPITPQFPSDHDRKGAQP